MTPRRQVTLQPGLPQNKSPGWAAVACVRLGAGRPTSPGSPGAWGEGGRETRPERGLPPTSNYEIVSAAAGSCPRISPAGFFFVCTFTYARPDSSAWSTDASTVARPWAPLLHGAHSGTI